MLNGRAGVYPPKMSGNLLRKVTRLGVIRGGINSARVSATLWNHVSAGQRPLITTQKE